VPVAADAFYVGDVNQLPESVTFDLSTVMTASTVTAEYYNGSWTALSGVSDGTSGFQTSGKNIVTYTYPTDAVAVSIDGVSAFWVRFRLSGTLTGRAIADRVWLDELIERLIEWGEGEHAFQIQSTPTGFETLRNVANTEGVWLANRGAGIVDQMVADDGTAYIPPVTRTFTVAGLQSGSEVRFYDAGVEVAGTESSGTSFGYSYVYSGTDDPLVIQIGKLLYVFQTRSGLALNEDQTIQANQDLDPNQLP
jgi:hypothetical protein